MATYDLEEEEQIEELKTWWKLHGTVVTAVITALALALAGWQGWSFWQRRQAAAASDLYATVAQAVERHDSKRARDVTGALIEQYGRTAYAGMAVLLAAEVQTETGGDLKSAHAQLAWAAQNAADPALRDLARLRLAALQIDAEDYNAALQTLADKALPAFAPRFDELKGDALAAQGKKSEARAAYQAGIDKHEKQKSTSSNWQAAYGEMLLDKIDALGK